MWNIMGKVKLIILIQRIFFYWVLDIIFIVMKKKRLKPQVLFTTELAMSGQITKLCEKCVLSSPSSFSI